MSSQGGEECSNNNHGVGVNFLPAMMPTEGSSKGPTMQNSLGHGAFFGWGGIGSDLNTKSCSNGGGVDDKSMRSGVGAWPGSIFPPPPTIAQLPTDNGFAERAARFSCFRSVMDNSAMSRFPRATNVSALMEEAHKGPAKGGVLSGNESDDAEATSTAAHEESSSSDQAKPSPSPSPSPSLSGKKRKKLTKIDVVPPLKDSKSTEVEKMKNIDSKVSENLKEKYDNKTKGELCSGTKASEATLKQAKEGPKNSDMPKDDYIHVRARRGQATNSHSLAERVRREKISERMKFLQDLVPGCSKVTGKAVMLDEIINYVQSLQRQVEFLSMKLAAVNPRLDFNVEGILAKDMLPTQSTSPTIMFTSDTSTSYPQLHQSSHGIVHVGTEGHGIVSQAEVLRRTITSQLACLDGHGFDNPNSQVQNVWDDELQSVVQMGFVQNSHIPLTSQGTSGPLSTSHLKTDA